jgi:sulfopyruvate decarboxylase TPP-binding subunit
MDRGKAICEELKKAGISHLVWVADSETHFMHEAINNNPDLKLVKVCREGETLAVCGGLCLGNAKPALLVENQGIFDSGNAVKWAAGLGFPIVMLIGYLMHRMMERTPEGVMMFKGMKDYTEPFLNAFDIKQYLINSDADVAKIGLACQEAYKSRRPVAALLTSADGYNPGG